MKNNNKNSKLRICPAPEGAVLTDRYIVRVDGRQVPVYDARVNDPDNAGYACFDFAGEVTVSVEIPIGFQNVKIRPLSSRIVPSCSGNIIEFKLKEPKKLSLEVNNSIDFPLFLFANAPESDIPDKDDPDVRFFGPGMHDAGEIRLEKGQTAYIAGGAIVKGYFTAEDTENIKISGRGIMDAHDNDTAMIRMVNCRNVFVEGIIIADQPTGKWTTQFWCCDDVEVRNIKIIAGDNVSNDGIDIVSCRNFTVDDCFVKCYDDCIVLKAIRTNRREIRNVRILNCLVWNIQAYGIQIGPELDTPRVSDILVKNCDIIHPQHTETDPGDAYYYYSAALGILNGDDSVVSNIRFEDIRIEDATAKLISIKIMKTEWNEAKGWGQIRDIYFKNISLVDSKFVPSEILSYGFEGKFSPWNNPEHTVVENVTFENLVILGKVIMNPSEGGFIINPYAKNIRFIAGQE